MQCSDAAWHPEVATQLVLASEDDHLPVVQLWDLRFATSPMKVFAYILLLIEVNNGFRFLLGIATTLIF